LSVASLAVSAVGSVNLGSSSNSLGTVAIAPVTGNVTVGASGSFLIGTVDGVTGIQTAAILQLTAGGSITQTEPVLAGSLLLTGTGGSNLANTANSVTTLAANTSGAVVYTNAGSLIVGSVSGTNGITASSLQLTTLLGTLTDAGSV